MSERTKRTEVTKETSRDTNIIKSKQTSNYIPLKELNKRSKEFTAKEFADRAELPFKPHITSNRSKKLLQEMFDKHNTDIRIIRCVGIYAGMKGCNELKDVKRMIDYEFNPKEGPSRERCCVMLPFETGSTKLTKEGQKVYKYIRNAKHEAGFWEESFIGLGFSYDSVRVMYKQDVASVVTKDGIRFPTRYSQTECRTIEDVKSAMYDLPKINVTDSNEAVVRVGTYPTCIYVRTTSPLFLLFCNEDSNYKKNLWKILGEYKVPILAWED